MPRSFGACQVNICAKVFGDLSCVWVLDWYSALKQTIAKAYITTVFNGAISQFYF